MLVLSRKVGETIKIGDNVTLVVTTIEGNRVAIGIDAPGDMPIVRGELELRPSMNHEVQLSDSNSHTEGEGSCQRRMASQS